MGNVMEVCWGLIRQLEEWMMNGWSIQLFSHTHDQQLIPDINLLVLEYIENRGYTYRRFVLAIGSPTNWFNQPLE